MDGEHCWGGDGEDGDIWGDGGVPHGQGSPPCSSLSESEVGGEAVLTVEMEAVFSLEDGEDGSNVTGEALRLTEEHNERVVGGEEVFEGINIPLYSLTVP